MDGRKRVLLADSSEEFRWLMWRSTANHNFFSLATVGSGRDVLLCMQKQTADLLFDAMYELFPGCSCGHWPHSPQ